MQKRWLVMATLLLALLALSGCQIPGTGLPDDGPPVAVSEESAASLEQKVGAAAITGGPTTLELTQEEVTSYVALRLVPAQTEATGQETVRISEPQVYFRDDGTMVLRGRVLFQGQDQPLRVVARPSASNGNLVVDITDGRIGPLPVPGALLDQVEGTLADAILAGQNYARLDSVQVGAGTLTITGERTQ